MKINKKQENYLFAVYYTIVTSGLVTSAAILISFVLRLVAGLTTTDYIDTQTLHSPAKLVFILWVGFTVMIWGIRILYSVATMSFTKAIYFAKKVYLNENKKY